MYETISGHRIYMEETYYLAYAGGMRSMTAAEEKEYRKILSLPFLLRQEEMKKQGPSKNPNLIPIKGRQLLEMIIDGKFVPFFDMFFEQSKTLQINDIIVYESMKMKSYDVALGR